MTADERAAHLKWCRDFIEHRCLFRSPGDRPVLTSATGGLNSYQFYMPIALLDQQFRRRVGMLFWDIFMEPFKAQAFQICGCESGGVPLICALQAAAPMPVNVFAVKKQAKSYGLRNWIEGMVLDKVPVLLVDDVVGQKKTMTMQAKRLREFGLELCGFFCVAACKLKRPLVLDEDERIETLFDADDFTTSHGGYVNKYGKIPQFSGVMA